MGWSGTARSTGRRKKEGEKMGARAPSLLLSFSPFVAFVLYQKHCYRFSMGMKSRSSLPK